MFLFSDTGNLRSNSNQRRRSNKYLKASNSFVLPVPSALIPPSKRVQSLLGYDETDAGGECISKGLQPHPLFSEMSELFCSNHVPVEWHETARWVKFEEDVEEGGNRWSKPHVATLNLHSLFELRRMIMKGSVILNLSATKLDEIADIILEDFVNNHRLPIEKRSTIREAILKRHCHQHEKINHSTDDTRNNNSESGFLSGDNKNGCTGNTGCSGVGKIKKLSVIRPFGKIGKSHSNTASGDGQPDSIPSKATSMKKSSTILGALSESSATQSNRSAFRFPKWDEHSKENNMKKSSTVMGIDNEFKDDAYLHSGTCIKMNTHLMKKLPIGAETSNILVGELDDLDAPISCFVRLEESLLLGDLTEVPVPTRFIFLLLGPAGEDNINLARYHEIGRSVATIMTDEVFHNVAYKATNRDDLIDGVDEFLDELTVLPPGEWDPTIRIEPPCHLPSQDKRKQKGKKKQPKAIVNEVDAQEKDREDSGLVRSGRLFGGLLNDIKRKKPFYDSDFKDGMTLKCLASVVFLYFACLTNYVTFGGLLGDTTENNIGTIESLVGAIAVGVGYGLFSGQPLSILGATGPILVFESIIFDICKTFEWEYLPFRMCVGIWMGIVLMVLVATDVSAFVCYITRFTEENFATLIAVIFIGKAFQKVTKIGHLYPIHKTPCLCMPSNTTSDLLGHGLADFNALPSSEEDVKKHVYRCSITINEDSNNSTSYVDGNIVIEGLQTPGCHYMPNIYLMSWLLFFGTFLIAYQLKKAKTSNFFPAKVKQILADFSVIIAIVIMTSIDYVSKIRTPKLDVPDTFQPTSGRDSWLIHPLGSNNPWWSMVGALLPALLGTILVFMDQQITVVIVNRKENKLKKGCGYHLDLFVIAILVVICSIFGLPWCEAATVLSIAHVQSLTRESESSAPGEKPKFLGIWEQRVTHIAIFVLVGLSVLMTPMLRAIPMPVLYGVFLYMGIASLNGLQFFDRILLFLMPQKYQPDYPYLRRVPLKRVHLFTFIQLVCLIGLIVIAEIKQASIVLPIVLVVMIGIRYLLGNVFDKNELKHLDDTLSEFSRHEKLDDEDKEDIERGVHSEKEENKTLEGPCESKNDSSDPKSCTAIPMINGNIMYVPKYNANEDIDEANEVIKRRSRDKFKFSDDINITEEVNKSSIWTSLMGEIQPSPSPKRKSSRREGSLNISRQKWNAVQSIVQETVAEVNEDHDFDGITFKRLP